MVLKSALTRDLTGCLTELPRFPITPMCVALATGDRDREPCHPNIPAASSTALRARGFARIESRHVGPACQSACTPPHRRRATSVRHPAVGCKRRI